MELLVVVVILAVLSALIFPVFARVKEGNSAPTRSNLRQIGVAWMLYLSDSNERFPDRRDLKTSLEGGYRPWNDWPGSDPRTGWALVALKPFLGSTEVWRLRPGHRLGEEIRVVQPTPFGPAMLWMWRFDRIDEPVPLDNFWGKTPPQCVADLVAADNPAAGRPDGESDVELATDPYFPKTIPSVPSELKGASNHPGGRHQLMLDMRVRFVKDRRLN